MMLCRENLAEGSSPLGGQGLFTARPIRRNDFVTFLTGEWGTSREIAASFGASHISLSYIAEWDIVLTSLPTRRSSRVRTALYVVSRTRHRQPLTPLVRNGGEVVDVGALMNSRRTTESNCFAESVIIRGADIANCPSPHEQFPAIILRARRHIAEGEELTWPYLVPGMVVPNVDEYREAPSNQAAISSAHVLRLWNASRPSRAASRLPPYACGTRVPLRYDHASREWILEARDAFRLGRAFDSYMLVLEAALTEVRRRREALRSGISRRKRCRESASPESVQPRE